MHAIPGTGCKNSGLERRPRSGEISDIGAHHAIFADPEKAFSNHPVESLESFVNIFRVSKSVNAPLRYVYSWCTDFGSDHLEIPGVKRRMLEATKRRAIYIEVYAGAGGQQKMGVDIVTLDPPTSWHMDYFGEDNDETGDYRLESLGRTKTRIEMRFRNKWKGSMTLSTGEKQKIESDAWDRYVAVLEKDFDRYER